MSTAEAPLGEVAVTGVAGQLGRAVVERLARLDVPVRGYDRCAWPAAPVPLVELDLTDVGPGFEWPSSVSTVLHLAGYREPTELTAGSIRLLYRANLETVAAALAACTDSVRHFVYVSSMAVYGAEADTPTTEAEPPAPDSLYGVSKLLGEHACGVFRRTHPGCAVTIVRLAQVYGPGSPEHLALYRLIHQGLRGDRLELQCAAELRRDYLYLTDAADALALAVVKGDDGVYNAGGGGGVAMGELVEAVAHALPHAVSTAFGSARGDDRVLDSRRFSEQVGFRPSIALSEGVRREVERIAAQRSDGEVRP